MMQLKDRVELWGPLSDSPGEDSHGNPLPPQTGLIASIPAHVYYSTASLSFDNDDARMVAAEQLRAIIPDTDVNLQADTSWLVWRGERYRVDGVMRRNARGKTHHLTLELSQRT